MKIRFLIPFVLGIAVGVVGPKFESRSVQAGSGPVTLELDDMERTAYEGVLENLDHEIEAEIRKLHEAYRARHPNVGEGRLVYSRGKGLFLVPTAQASPSAPVSSAIAASPTPKR